MTEPEEEELRRFFASLYAEPSPKPPPNPIDIGVDLDTFTFHTGGREAVEEMIANGTFSGFRREVGGMPNFIGQPRKRKPPAKPAKPPAPEPAKEKGGE